MTVSQLAIAFGCVAVGCGDPANEIEFKGEALAEIACVVAAVDYLPTPGTRLQLALLWQTPAGGYAPNDSGSDIASSFPANAIVRVFRPPDASLMQSREGVTGELAIGQLTAFEDGDGDGIWDPTEAFVGMSQSIVVVFTRTGVGGQPTGSLVPGFHRLAPNGCGDPSLPRFLASDDDTCYVTLAAKVLIRFELTCAPDPTGPCVGLSAIRAACQLDPDDARCTTCAAGLYPEGATEAECDAWYDDCVAAFEPELNECGAERKACVAGGFEPEDCPRECVCAPIYDQCVKAGGTPEVCAEKRRSCLGAPQ